MVLVDTSVWVDHLRAGNTSLKTLLRDGEVACHPFIVGELACGNIKNREEFIALLQTLPVAQVVNQEEFLYFVEQNKFMGKGVGFVDVHLLASACLSETPVWTLDKKLEVIAAELHVNFEF